MVEKMYNIKNEILERIEKDIAEKGIDRINVSEMGELVDMAKDLAEAEAACWQAQYYRLVSEAMQSGSSGYSAVPQAQARSGYGQMPGYRPMGHTDLIDPLRNAMRNASPEERERIRNEIMAAI